MSRIKLALLGAMLAMAVGGTLAAMTARQVGLQVNNSGSIASSATAADDTSAADQPTDTPTNTGSPPRIPTATRPPSAQTHEIVGTIDSVGSSSFVLNAPGGQYTMNVNNSTQYSGTAKTLQQMGSGWSAEIHYVKQSNGMNLALEVNAQPGSGTPVPDN